MTFIKRHWKKIIAVLLLIFVMEYPSIKEHFNPPPMLTYAQLVENVQENNIKKIETSENSSRVVAYLKNDEVKQIIIPDKSTFNKFITEQIRAGNSVEYEIKEVWSFSSILSTLFNLLIIWFMYKMVSNVAGNSAKDYEVKPAKSEYSFENVAGIDEEKERIQEIVQFLTNPKKYEEIGAKVPRGILLTGAPGTGKTLLAKAIAGEAQVPFFQVNGSSFEEKWVGVGASRVRKLFEEAKEAAPSIIFIDEIDSLAKSRYNDSNSNNEQTLNQLLSEMDGFESNSSVIVIAATNYPEILDPAILRAGRFDRKIFIPTPDPIAREKILCVHAKNKVLAKDVSLKEIAKKTAGFSGADLENILNEAAIHAVNNGQKEITRADIEEAIAVVLVGLEKRNVLVREEDRYLTAIHEAGHAVVSAVLRPNVNNLGISIVPRGKAGGYNHFNGPDAQYARKEELKKNVQSLYGGRAAEEIIIGSISTGASNDLEEASKIVYNMVNVFGMNNDLLVRISNNGNYNKLLESQRIEQMQKICEEYYKETLEILKTYQTVVIALAQLLLKVEYLDQNELDEFMKNNLKN